MVRRRGLTISRRQALIGLSGITLGLPWLEKLDGSYARAQTAANRPKRVITLAYEMGVPLGAFRPSATGTMFTLPYVTAPLERFKDRCLFVTSIDHLVHEAGGDSFIYGHPAKKEAALTGTLTTGAFPANNSNRLSELRADRTTSGGANGPSFDHLIGQFLRGSRSRPSVDLAVDGNSHELSVPSTMPSNFFFEGAGNPISLMGRPHEALNAVFAGVNASTGPSQADLELRKLRARNKSVLDAVRASFTELKQGLSKEDKARLEDHAARIRQLEIDVKVAAGCSIPADIANGGNYRGQTMGQVAAPMVKILANAMACDLAPVGRLEFINQDSPRFGIAALDTFLDGVGSGYNWHSLVHGDPLPNTSTYARPGRGGATTYHPHLLDGYRFFVQQFADLLDQLDAIQEGPETTVLDNSLVVLASDLGEGLGHAHMKMAYVIAGGLGGARRGYHLDAGPSRAFEIGGEYFYAPSKYTVNQLLNSMLDMAGVTGASGAPVTMGLQGFLEDRRMPRRIDELFG